VSGELRPHAPAIAGALEYVDEIGREKYRLYIFELGNISVYLQVQYRCSILYTGTVLGSILRSIQENDVLLGESIVMTNY
jgi:hypothetical protein